MRQAYTDVAAEEIPHAIQVFDKLHLVERLSEAVDEVRRQEARQLKDTNPEVLQKARYIFPKNPCNLTDKQKVSLADL